MFLKCKYLKAGIKSVSFLEVSLNFKVEISNIFFLL